MAISISYYLNLQLSPQKVLKNLGYRGLAKSPQGQTQMEYSVELNELRKSLN